MLKDRTRMLDRIRTAISKELQTLGVADVTELRETILIRDGLFCGRKFQCQDHHVVWFMEENEIKFFGPRGQLLMATSPERCLAMTNQPADAVPLHRAA